MHKTVSLVVISPVRNEARHLQRTIDSVAGQERRPARWVIVDDGSSDETAEIAERAAARHSWIQVLRRKDRGFRQSGSGIMDAFYDGLRLIDGQPWDCLLKLDGDLEFGPDTFGAVIDAMGQDPRLGIAGGDIYHYEHEEMVVESKGDPAFHVRGATKFYRRDCWEQMRGVPAVTGWDTLDEVKATMLGWRTGRVAKARFLHLRPTGAADGGWKNAFKNGRGAYICGYHPLYMASKCVKRLLDPPILVQSLGLFAGFLTGYWKGKGRIEDPDLVRYLQRQQLRRLIGLPSIWR